jgi:hypothetical protein
MAASFFPNPSSTTPAEKEKEAVPEPKAVNERVPRLKADVCKASSSVGESREISANSTIPGENMKSVKASGGSHRGHQEAPKAHIRWQEQRWIEADAQVKRADGRRRPYAGNADIYTGRLPADDGLRRWGQAQGDSLHGRNSAEPYTDKDQKE